MNPSKSFYGESLFDRNKHTYGLHPKCKKCLALKKEKCENPQYAAMGVKDFYCADHRDEDEAIKAIIERANRAIKAAKKDLGKSSIANGIKKKS